MALIDCDSFDYYTSATQRWPVQNAGGSISISAGNGRKSTACLRRSTPRCGAFRTLAASHSELVQGGSFRSSNLTGDGGLMRFPIMQFCSAGNPIITLYVRASDGVIEVARGATNGTVIGTTSYVYALLSTVYVEWRVKFSTTVGTVEVRVNGNVVLDLTAGDKNTGGASVNQWGFGDISSAPASGGANGDHDDAYLCTVTGSKNNTFLGDVTVDALFADGAGSSSGWARGGADSGANWSQVDETAPNDDTDYVSASVVGTKDLYTFDSLASATGAVKAIALSYRVKKDDAGLRTVKGVLESGGAEQDGANFNPGTSYVYQQDFSDTNPDTAADWTISDVNGMQAGYEVVA